MYIEYICIYLWFPESAPCSFFKYVYVCIKIIHDYNYYTWTCIDYICTFLTLIFVLHDICVVYQVLGLVSWFEDRERMITCWCHHVGFWSMLLGTVGTNTWKPSIYDRCQYVYIYIFVARSGNGVPVVFAICFFAVANMHFWIVYMYACVYRYIRIRYCMHVMHMFTYGTYTLFTTCILFLLIQLIHIETFDRLPVYLLVLSP